ncbi:MAG: glutathione S-transferase N-terminal domain-containing protein [Pseudomonadota bacterium]
MSLILYDLAAANSNIRFSPNCWRVKFALALKGLTAVTVPCRFTEKALIAPSGQRALPVLVDGDLWVAESWQIALYLEQLRPEQPLFPNGPQPLVFLRHWIDSTLHPAILRLILLPLYDILAEEDRAYFRESREARFGMSLEAASTDWEEGRAALSTLLEPARKVLASTAWLGGDTPDFGDCMLAGALRWAEIATQGQPVLEAADPIALWYARLLRRAAPTVADEAASD